MPRLTEEQIQEINELARKKEYQHHEDDDCLGILKKKHVIGEPNYTKIGKKTGFSVYTAKYHLNPEYRKKVRKRGKSDKAKKKVREWFRLPMRLLELFDKDSNYTSEELAEMLGHMPTTIEREIKRFERQLGDKTPIKRENGVYSLNMGSPYWVVTDGYHNEPFPSD